MNRQDRMLQVRLETHHFSPSESVEPCQDRLCTWSESVVQSIR